MSAALIWIMCAVIAVSLALWLAAVAIAVRNPAVKEPRRQRQRDPADR